MKSAFINEHIHHLLDYLKNAKFEFEIDSEIMKDRIMFHRGKTKTSRTSILLRETSFY